jgi:hypothetical protein
MSSLRVLLTDVRFFAVILAPATGLSGHGLSGRSTGQVGPACTTPLIPDLVADAAVPVLHEIDARSSNVVADQNVVRLIVRSS